MPIAVIALSTLSLASQAIASQAIAYLIYSSPTATTVWTAGQPATVSWANSCNEVVGNTTFPIYIMAPVGDTSDIIGYLDCKMPGTSNVMVRATLPQGPYFISVSTGAFTGGFSSRSDSFLILASTSGSTTTILSTTILPTTTVILTTTSPANPTGSSPAASNEGDDTKSNGAVIGGSIAAAVIAVITAVALLFFRRLRRQQQPQNVARASIATSPSNRFLSSMENPSGGPGGRESQHDKSLKQSPIHSPQYIPMRVPQDGSSNPQDQIYQLQKENMHSQFALSGNTQLFPANAQDHSFSTRRSPQGTHAPIPKDDSQDMQQQIHMLQTELNRLQARLNTEN